MFTNEDRAVYIKHYGGRDSRFIGVRFNKSRGKRIFSIESLKFIKVNGDKNSSYRCCKTYYIGKGEKHRIVYCDIFDYSEFDSYFYTFDNVRDFTDVVFPEELSCHSYVITDSLIRDKIAQLNEEVVMELKK